MGGCAWTNGSAVRVAPNASTTTATLIRLDIARLSFSLWRVGSTTNSGLRLLHGVWLDLQDLGLVERAAFGREHDLAPYLGGRRRVEEGVPDDVGRRAERLQHLEHGHAGLHLRDLVEAGLLAGRQLHSGDGHHSHEEPDRKHPSNPRGRTSHVFPSFAAAPRPWPSSRSAF